MPPDAPAAAAAGRPGAPCPGLGGKKRGSRGSGGHLAACRVLGGLGEMGHSPQAQLGDFAVGGQSISHGVREGEGAQVSAKTLK